MRSATLYAALLLIGSAAVVSADTAMRGVSSPERAKSLYQLHCQGCHLPAGEGFPANDIPRLTDHIGYFTWLEDGRQYLVQVPGAAGSPVDDEDLAEITNWMIYTFNPDAVSDDFSPYSGEEIATLRHGWQGDVVKRRNELIEALKQLDDYPGETGETTNY